MPKAWVCRVFGAKRTTLHDALARDPEAEVVSGAAAGALAHGVPVPSGGILPLVLLWCERGGGAAFGGLPRCLSSVSDPGPTPRKRRSRTSCRALLPRCPRVPPVAPSSPLRSKQRICWSPPRSSPHVGRSPFASSAGPASDTIRRRPQRLTSPTPLQRPHNHRSDAQAPVMALTAFLW